MVEDLHPRANGSVDWRSLPDFAPDAGLWPRVLAAQQRRQRTRQRWRRSFALAGAALVAGAVVLLRPAPAPLMQGSIAASQIESRQLESQWRQMASTQPGDAAVATRMRAIDAALQAAYDRGGAKTDLAPLWRQRNQVLRIMIARNRIAKEGAESVVVHI